MSDVARRVESIADAARLLGVHPKTVDRWVRLGHAKLDHRDELGRRYIDVTSVGADIVRRARIMQEARYPDKPGASPEQQGLLNEVAWLRAQLGARDRQISDLIALVTKLSTRSGTEGSLDGDGLEVFVTPRVGHP